MKYKVTIGWQASFEFDDAHTALNFAEIALTHRVEECESVRITITDEEKELIIHCEECKYYDPREGGRTMCRLHDRMAEDKVYCWWGERKGGDSE